MVDVNEVPCEPTESPSVIYELIHLDYGALEARLGLDPAEPNAWKRFSREHHWYVYELWSGSVFDDSGPLYVGRTNSIPRRLAEHRASKRWWPEVGQITVSTYITLGLAVQHEDDLIDTWQPRYNVHGVRNG